MVTGWSPTGTIDPARLVRRVTIYTSSPVSSDEVRRDLDQRFARLYHDLEQGTDALATSIPTPT